MGNIVGPVEYSSARLEVRKANPWPINADNPCAQDFCDVVVVAEFQAGTDPAVEMGNRLPLRVSVFGVSQLPTVGKTDLLTQYLRGLRSRLGNFVSHVRHRHIRL